jgi:DEAD/DEAH box helicase domain-containing protein
MNLAGKNILVYDLEIQKNPEDCTHGWKSHSEFGVSVACAFDYREMRFRVFMQDNLKDLSDRLNQDGTLVVGFNHVRFDNAVLRGSGCALKADSELKNFDMLLASRAGAGVNEFAKGFKLDDHLRALSLPMKTADGLLALKLWKEKRLGELVDYCMNDVQTEKNLFEYVMNTGLMATAGKPSPYFVKRPEL